MKRIITVTVLTCSAAFIAGHSPAAEERDAKMSKAVKVADEIIEMRSALAGTFIKPDTEITEETFKNVCGAVGKRVKEISESEKFRIRHAAVKNRNPMFAATEGEKKILDMFERDRSIKEKWDTVIIDEKNYLRYMRPIFVEEACLACHGPKDKRPAFIKEKYPDDRAFDFKTGDLRGMIEVMFGE